MEVCRYSLAGGYQANSENVSGSDYCRLPNQGYSLISNISNEVQKAMDGWMNSSWAQDYHPQCPSSEGQHRLGVGQLTTLWQFSNSRGTLWSSRRCQRLRMASCLWKGQ